jgi:hypothetical protein
MLREITSSMVAAISKKRRMPEDASASSRCERCDLTAGWLLRCSRRTILKTSSIFLFACLCGASAGGWL